MGKIWKSEYRGGNKQKQFRNKCMSCNVRSIMNKGKREEFRHLMSEKGLAIVGVTESWAHEEIGDAEINIKGYSVFKQPPWMKKELGN